MLTRAVASTGEMLADWARPEPARTATSATAMGASRRRGRLETSEPAAHARRSAANHDDPFAPRRPATLAPPPHPWAPPELRSAPAYASSMPLRSSLPGVRTDASPARV